MRHMPLALGILSSLILIMGKPVGYSSAQDIDGSPICAYPNRPPREPFGTRRPDAVIRSNDQEDNNTREQAQKVQLGFGAGQDPDIDLNGNIQAPFDNDFFEVSLAKGDILGVSCLDFGGLPSFDPRVEVQDSNGVVLIENDNHRGVGDLYPPNSDMPVGGQRDDAVVALAIPKTGRYYIRARGIGASTGQYFLQLRLREPGMRSELTGQKQILFLDFDGQQIIRV